MAMPTEMGLAILAGALGLAFVNIDKISKFKGAGFEAEMRLVSTMIENQTEPTQREKDKLESVVVEGISEEEEKILKSLQHPKYTWRYASSIGKEISLSKSEIEKILRGLRTLGFVKNGQGVHGEIWTITSLGKSYHQQHVD